MITQSNQMILLLHIFVYYIKPCPSAQTHPLVSLSDPHCQLTESCNIRCLHEVSALVRSGHEGDHVV